MSAPLRVLKKIDVELSLTPMIDVTFLLLIFFMVTAKFRASEGKLQAYLPREKGIATGPSREVDETRIRLRAIGPRGAAPERVGLSIGRRDFGERRYADEAAVSPDFGSLVTFLSELKARRAGQDPLEVRIDAEPAVPWRFVVRTLNACLDADVPHVTFAESAAPMDAP